MQNNLIKRFFFAILLTLSACSMLPEKADETKNWPAAKFYSEAKEDIETGNYDSAIKNLEKLESRYPFGVYAQQAQMEIAYVYYKQGDQAQALAAIERFIKLHPNSDQLDYIYYLRGLVNFNDQVNFFQALAGQDMTERDPKAAREAFDSFKALAVRYPNSKYTPDALLRMKYLVNTLAQYDLHVAKYYFRRGAYVASANRAQTAIKEYPDAPAIEEALFVLSKSYDQMGLTTLRDDTMRVFNLNFPNSKFTHGGEEEQAWWKIW